MKREDFTEFSNQRVTAMWDATLGRWVYRWIVIGSELTRAEMMALGLDAPLDAVPVPVEPVAFSQRDGRWANVRLGASSHTMGSAGCVVTACTMVASVVQREITPLEMVTWLNANGGFTSGGLLYWAKAAEFVPGLSWVSYHLWRNTPADLAILASALEDGPQVIQVDFRPQTSVLDSHFVTATAMTADGRDVHVIDPWTGEAGTLLGLYGNPGWPLARAVYALAEFAFL